MADKQPAANSPMQGDGDDDDTPEFSVTHSALRDEEAGPHESRTGETSRTTGVWSLIRRILAPLGIRARENMAAAQRSTATPKHRQVPSHRLPRSLPRRWQELERIRCPKPGSKRQLKCCPSMEEPVLEVMPEITRGHLKYHAKYRARLPWPGLFQCSRTGLRFKVNSAATIDYRYDTWERHLSKAGQEMWVPAGPLFHIEVQHGIVQEVHLPHFICLAGDIDTTLCFIAHFKSGKMTPKTPTRLIPFFAVLENPNFSLLGVMWRRLRSALNAFPIHSLVLIFRQLSAANTTLHFYLIPDDSSVKEAIEKQEKQWNSKLIPKPPPLNPLLFGCTYQVTSTNPVVITPEAKLPFCYKSPKEQQLFVEIYIREMAEEIELLVTDTRNGAEIWKAVLRSGDISPPACVPRALSGAAFIKKHKTKLRSRMRQVSLILLDLRDAEVINSDDEEEVRCQDTSKKKNQVLLKLVEKKGLEAQEQLYQILQKKDPYLVTDLENSG